MAKKVRPSWQVKLLGSPAIRQVGSSWTALGSKSAALLTYLALQGPTSRVRLAHLLWPDLSDRSARAYLRHLIYELQRYEGLLVKGDPLDLTTEVSLDLAEAGQLLEGFEFDDCPEFAEWLGHQRLQLHVRKIEALSAEIKGLVRQGDFATALPLARQWVVSEPFSEEASRQLMRLLYLNGDRGAALAAYHRCQQALKLELGVEPLAETAALAREIKQGSALPQTGPMIRREIPLSVARPPVLVGREREWALMEEAWDRGQVILLSGEAGLGKTRLMLDFAGAKGSFSYSEARPGESSLPYNSARQFIRKVLKDHPYLKPEAWICRELSRLVTELAEDEPLPLHTVEDARRVLDAAVELVMCLRPWLCTCVIDNLHLFDRNSFRVWSYAVSRATTAVVGGEGVRILAAVRLGELNPRCVTELRRLVDAEIAVLIELEPLSAEGVDEMLSAMELSGHETLVDPLYRITGGNPLFIVEMLKSLITLGKLAPGELKNVFPVRLGAVFGDCFQRLSAIALKLVQLIAVAQEDFSVDLAARALNVSALEVAEALAELEGSQLIRGTDFSYDLVREAVERLTPAAIASFFHRSCAEYLEGRRGDPVRIAHHWWEAGEVKYAMPHYLSAAEAALSRGALPQARDWLVKIIACAPQESALREAALRLAQSLASLKA